MIAGIVMWDIERTSRLPSRLRLPGWGSAIAVALVALFGLALPVAFGCALCTEFPGGSGPRDPRLLELASAIQHEIDSGGLDLSPGAALPTSGRGLGHRMTRMLHSHPDRDRSLELVLIDSGACFRFDPRRPERGFLPVPKERSQPPARRWLTNLDVFHALLDGRMGIDTAEVRGILVIESVPEGEAIAAGNQGPEPDASGVQNAGDRGARDSQRSGSAVVLVGLALLIAVPVLLVLRSHRKRGEARTPEHAR